MFSRITGIDKTILIYSENDEELDACSYDGNYIRTLRVDIGSVPPREREQEYNEQC